jgi:DNA/RNA endonuclease G (NUC1)
MRSRIYGAAFGALTFFASSCTDGHPTAPISPTTAAGGASMYTAPASAVRITELHYDNAGTDAGEAIELTGPANMSLAGWTLVLYNGTGGVSYGTTNLTALNAACGDRGVLVVTFPSNGIQNGPPDGVALVDASGAVVEFLSYEGTFAATNGPASGVTSTDIGVSQSGSGAAGQSLQRSTITLWQAEQAANFGACNYSEEAPGEITGLAVAPSTATVPVGATQTLVATATDADGNVVPATVTWTSSDETVAVVDAAGTVTGIAPGTATIAATAGALTASATLTVEAPTPPPPGGAVWISELHYDNYSTDANEAIEIEGPAGTSLSGWRVYLYNGNGATQYRAIGPLTAVIPSQCEGRGTLHVPAPGIQNGDPDGVALVDAANTVVDFISYGGTITAADGPAVGMTSRDVGVKEGSSTSATNSLQRKGGTWYGPIPATFGACNGDAPPPPPETRVTFTGRSSDDPDLPVGYEDQLFATYLVGTVATPTTFTWRSADERIATVDQEGVVHAVAAGSVRVEAVAADGTIGSVTLRTQAGSFSPTADYLNSIEFGAPTDGDASDDHVISRPQFTASYSYRRNTPNWVSWTLDASQFGPTDRCDCFTMDPMLPASFTRITTADYTGAGAVAGYGIDRGHLVRSFDRTGAILDNAATFLFSNIIPQAADNNQGPWAALEFALGDSARAMTHVVYNIAGVAGTRGTVKNEGVITIPAYVWKVAILMPRGRGIGDLDSYDDVQVIAVVMPNVAGIRNESWQRYAVTVDSVEALSGYDVLALLRDDIEIAVESNTAPPAALTDGPYHAIQNEGIAMSAAGSSDPDGDALSYAWNFGDGTTASGVAATHAYAQPGTYTIRLIATDVRGLADTTTTTATVLSYAAALEQAVAMTSALIANGSINQGNGRALIAKLDAALQAEATDRRSLLVHLTQASRQLEGFVRVGHIAADDAAPLGTLLQRITAALGG